MNAYQDIIEILEQGEECVAIVFGAYGWGDLDDDLPILGYGEPDPPFVPFEIRGKILSIEQAEPYMKGWSFYGGFGAPDCYAVYIWTNQRVIWVTQYDGATGLNWAPRHPVGCIPDMPGG